MMPSVVIRVDTKVYIPGTYNVMAVASMKANAFKNCSSVASVRIPSSVGSIGENAFYVCSNLKGVTIPDNVTFIGNKAFYGCSGLRSVTVGNGVTSISARVFYNCGKLTDIHIEGTVAQWNAITKGTDWDYKTPSYTVHCTDGDVSK